MQSEMTFCSGDELRDLFSCSREALRYVTAATTIAVKRQAQNVILQFIALFQSKYFRFHPYTHSLNRNIQRWGNYQLALRKQAAEENFAAAAAAAEIAAAEIAVGETVVEETGEGIAASAVGIAAVLGLARASGEVVVVWKHRCAVGTLSSRDYSIVP
ncbi:hypothetical protein [Bradyrhizobium sp. S69]|uniref:hypothetical protein n=1 Tax=Bradyrhizobium sp. S69 TaxID=1641856 RepID=UPI001AEE64DF|nr:hypothetical protein [Bradyrhizobium sp. S69]